MNKCKLCIEQGHPAHFLSEPKCAFASGEFSPENWMCPTAGAIRRFMGEDTYKGGTSESFYIRRDDQSYGALWVPPHPSDVPDGKEVGPWRGGGLIAGYWYKHRGATDMLIRVDPRNGGRVKDAARPLTLIEAEAALENCRLRALLESATGESSRLAH